MSNIFRPAVRSCLDRSWYTVPASIRQGLLRPAASAVFSNSPIVEGYVDGGIRLLKIWLEVGQEEPERRFHARIDDPMRQWKLSPMDVESFKRWYDFSKARDLMLDHTDSVHAPWYVVDSNDKKRARLNVISHILSQIPYKRIEHDKVKLPERSPITTIMRR